MEGIQSAIAQVADNIASQAPGARSPEGAGNTPASADLAPDSANSTENQPTEAQIIDLAKQHKFLWDGKEMTPDEFRKAQMRLADYTKKTKALAEERRKFDEERTKYTSERELAEQFESNVEIDIQNVLRDPSLEEKFKQIYPQKYHATLDEALTRAFGDKNDPKRNESLLEQRLRAIEGRFQNQDIERAQKAFELEVSKDEEILNSLVERLSTKYPMADEDSVLARAEHLAVQIKKDKDFQKNFSSLMEKLYQENHKYHDERYKSRYKQAVEKQKTANNKARDAGRGGATPATPAERMKLKDVKNHILSTMGV